MPSEVGVGRPSKYFALPEASWGTLPAVTLKRARRRRPHRAKEVRKNWSSGVRRPIARAAAAGETQKEIWRVECVRSGCASLAVEEDMRS